MSRMTAPAEADIPAARPSAPPLANSASCRTSHRDNTCGLHSVELRLGCCAWLPGTRAHPIGHTQCGTHASCESSSAGMWKSLMTHSRSWHPGWARMPSRVFTDSGSAVRRVPRLLRFGMLARPSAPSLALGIAVAASFLVVETLVVCSLNVVTRTTGCFATLYLIGVIAISTLWGFGLSATMSIASAIAFSYFRDWPTGHFAPYELQDWISIGVFLVVALVANALAGLAREGERFFDLSPDMMCITDSDRILRVNPAFIRTLGYPLDDLASRPYLDLIVPEDRDDARILLEQLPGSAEPVRFQNQVTRSDASRRCVEWSVVWDRGLFYAVGRDATRRRAYPESTAPCASGTDRLPRAHRLRRSRRPAPSGAKPA